MSFLRKIVSIHYHILTWFVTRPPDGDEALSNFSAGGAEGLPMLCEKDGE